MDNDLLEKVIELSREVGEMKKENEMLKVANSILEDKFKNNLNKNTFTEEELDSLVNILHLLFNIDRKIILDGKKINYTGKEKIYEDMPDKRIIK